MWSVQQPLSAAALGDVIVGPAWKHVPTWFLVARNDEVIPADAQRLFASRMGAATTEVDSSHVLMVSHPDEFASVIDEAATSA